MAIASTPKPDSHQAEPPRPPASSSELGEAQRERERYIREREGVERVSIVRGLIVLALVVLLFSIWRAGIDRVLPGRWWWP